MRSTAMPSSIKHQLPFETLLAHQSQCLRLTRMCFCVFTFLELTRCGGADDCEKLSCLRHRRTARAALDPMPLPISARRFAHSVAEHVIAQHSSAQQRQQRQTVPYAVPVKTLFAPRKLRLCAVGCGLWAVGHGTRDTGCGDVQSTAPHSAHIECGMPCQRAASHRIAHKGLRVGVSQLAMAARSIHRIAQGVLASSASHKGLRVGKRPEASLRCARTAVPPC
eukprot:2046367-Rhodomonas_salina.1